jgi:hypothetical protein
VGILIPAGDVDALTAALGAALERRWDEEAIERTSRRSWDDMGREIWRFIADLLPNTVESACRNPKS